MTLDNARLIFWCEIQLRSFFVYAVASFAGNGYTVSSYQKYTKEVGYEKDNFGFCITKKKRTADKCRSDFSDMQK